MLLAANRSLEIHQCVLIDIARYHLSHPANSHKSTRSIKPFKEPIGNIYEKKHECH